MPRLDGYQTCAIIKRNPRFAHVPVIMLSSKDGLFDKARGRMVGSEDYLTKPFTKEQLLRAVAAVPPARPVRCPREPGAHPNRGPDDADPQDPGGRRFQDRAAPPVRAAGQARLHRAHRRERRRGPAPPGRGKARPDPDGRGDARPERLPAHPHDHARPALCRRAGDHVHQQEPGNRQGLGHAPGRKRLRRQAGQCRRAADQDPRLRLPPDGPSHPWPSAKPCENCRAGWPSACRRP
jgi:hypothetical protein